MIRLLLVTAVNAEADAVCAGMMGPWRPEPPAAVTAVALRGNPSPAWERQLLTAVRLGPYRARRSGAVTVLAAGAAGAAAAAGTATALATAHSAGEPFDLVISLGIAGGFADRAKMGDLVVADALIAADAGAEAPGPGGPDQSLREPAHPSSPPGGEFLDLEQLGLGPSALIPREDVVRALVDVLTPTGRNVEAGPVISVSTVTGSDQRAAMLALRFNPVAEAMEGYAVGVAASAFDTPFAEVRAISNTVGIRDRVRWDVPGALAGLSGAAAGLAAGINTLGAIFDASDIRGPVRPASGLGTV